MGLNMQTNVHPVTASALAHLLISGCHLVHRLSGADAQQRTSHQASHKDEQIKHWASCEGCIGSGPPGCMPDISDAAWEPPPSVLFSEDLVTVTVKPSLM